MKGLPQCKVVLRRKAAKMQPMLLAFLLSIAAADAPGGEVGDYSQIAKLTATDAT